MKKRFIIACLLSVMAVSMVSAACSCNSKKPSENSSQSSFEQEAGLTIAPEVVNLYTYQSTLLTANAEGVHWSSSDINVARVDGAGKVTGISDGVATITATQGTETATCRVTVIDDASMPVLALDNRYLALEKESSYTVSASVSVRGESLEEAAYTWTVVDGQAVASVQADATGRKVTVTGLEYGSALIKAEATVGNVTLTNFVEVDVKNSDVWFEVTNVANGEGVFDVELYLEENASDRNSIAPIIKAYEGETEKTALTFSWSSDNSDIATVTEGGLITAVAAGKTYVRANCSVGEVVFAVTVPYAVATLSKEIDIELAEFVNSLTVDVEIPSQITEEITSVRLGETEILSSATSAVMKIDKSKVADKMGEHTLVIQTANHLYTASCKIATMVIRTAADLDEFGTVAKAMSDKPYVWDGYFLLGNDISYNKTYVPFISMPKLTAICESVGINSWDHRTVGFKGTFDGGGHTIDGLETNDWWEDYRGGFIGTLNVAGTIKNLSFTNAVHYGKGGFLTSFAAGRIENVFIHAKKQYIYRDVNYPTSFISAMLVSQDSFWELKIKNTFVLVEEYEGDAEDLAYACSLGSIYMNNGSLENVYAIGGVNKAVNRLINPDGDMGVADVYGSYATISEFLAAGVDLSAFDGDYWNVEQGIPIPNGVSFDRDTFINITETSMTRGSSISFERDYFTVVEVDAVSKALGIVVEGNTLTVPDTATVGHVIYLTARSLFDEASEAQTYEISVIGSRTELTATPIEIDAYHAGDTLTVDLSAQKENISGELIYAKIGATQFTAANYDAATGILSLDAATVGKLFGAQTIEAYFEKEEGGSIVEAAKISIPTTVYSMIIYTVEDLNSFGSWAKTYSTGKFTWDGYFVLGNNLTYNDTSKAESAWNTYAPFVSVSMLNRDGGDAWGYAGEVGFKGIFDGRGYNIDGFKTSSAWPYDRGGFIGILNKDGVIKNLSFTNAVHAGKGGFLTTMAGGKIENVFIRAKKHCITQDEYYPDSYRSAFLVAQDSRYMLQIKNCVVIIDEYEGVDADLAYASSLGSFYLNNGSLQNVYAIGGTNKAVSELINPDGNLGIADVYGSYAGETEFKAANVDVSSFDQAFWDTSSGVPVSRQSNGLM